MAAINTITHKEKINCNLFLLIMPNKQKKKRPSDIFLTPVMTAGLGFSHHSILEKNFFSEVTAMKKLQRKTNFRPTRHNAEKLYLGGAISAPPRNAADLKSPVQIG